MNSVRGIGGGIHGSELQIFTVSLEGATFYLRRSQVRPVFSGPQLPVPGNLWDPQEPARRYFSESAPALAHWLSCALVIPETPIAPTIFPSTTSGMPPSDGTTPGKPRVRRFSPPFARAS